jgi:hypothetical protein
MRIDRRRQAEGRRAAALPRLSNRCRPVVLPTKGDMRSLQKSADAPTDAEPSESRSRGLVSLHAVRRDPSACSGCLRGQAELLLKRPVLFWRSPPDAVRSVTTLVDVIVGHWNS